MRETFLQMKRRDEEVRAALAEQGDLFVGYHPEMERVHDENATALAALVKQNGWAGVSSVGEDGCEAAFLVAVHGIRFNEGRPQVYGTCMDWDEVGILGPGLLEDPASVDRLRKEVGLPPLAAAIAEARRNAVREGEPRPTDWKARRLAFEAWAREVGWR